MALFITALVLSVVPGIHAYGSEALFGKSYALVVGVQRYSDSYWPSLAYAKRDADGIAEFLRLQGYEVHELYDENATRTDILTTLGEQIAPKLTEDDRVVVFFPVTVRQEGLAVRISDMSFLTTAASVMGRGFR